MLLLLVVGRRTRFSVDASRTEPHALARRAGGGTQDGPDLAGAFARSMTRQLLREAARQRGEAVEDLLVVVLEAKPRARRRQTITATTPDTQQRLDAKEEQGKEEKQQVYVGPESEAWS